MTTQERRSDIIGSFIVSCLVVIGIVALGFLLMFLIALLVNTAEAHDEQMLHSMYSDWMNNLHNKNNAVCCTNNEGSTLKDVDWTVSDGKQCTQTEIEAAHPENGLGKYCVRIDGTWWYVPDKAVIEESNKYGPAVVWPIWASKQGAKNTVSGIRCFMPGSFS